MLTKEEMDGLTEHYRESLEKMNESGQYTGNFYKDFSSIERKLLENSQAMNAEALSHLASSISKDHKKKKLCLLQSEAQTCRKS